LTAYAAKLDKAKGKRDLLRIESRAGYLYFRNYSRLFDKKKYAFISRHGGEISLGSRYASDPINGALN
jgi:CRISPR/Cas system-associated endonuclease Cas1